MNEHQHHNSQNDIKEEFTEAADTFKEMIPSGKLNLMKELKDAIEVVKMKTEKIHAVSMRKKAALPALLIIIAGVMAVELGEYLNSLRYIEVIRPMVAGSYNLVALLASFLIVLVSTLGIIFVYEIIGTRVFKGKGDFGQLFRVIGYGNLVLVASLVPILRGIAYVWYAVIVYEAIKQVKKLEPMKAVLTIIISMVIISLIAALISLLFGNMIMDIYGLGLSYFR
jgi:hypothetical protein